MKNHNIRKTTLITSLGTAALMAVSSVTATKAADDADDAEKVDFEKQVLPLIKDKCIKCHLQPYKVKKGKRLRTKKPKSGLRFDAAKFYKQGGDLQEDEDKKTLVPGKADESHMYTMTTLPEDDDLFMPPEGKADPLTDKEKETLKNWINQGADFGGWVGNEDESTLDEIPEDAKDKDEKDDKEKDEKTEKE